MQGDGSVTTNQQSAISSFEWKPSFSRSNLGEMRETVGEYQNQASQHREMASESVSAANTLGSQIFSTAQTSRGSETTTGQQMQDALSQSQNLTRSWSDRLVNEYGFDRRAADELSRLSYMNGTGRLGLGSPIPGLTAGIDASVLSQEGRTRASSSSVNERISKGLDFLNAESTSDTASHSRESFFRAASTSGSSELEGLSQRRDASLTEARGHTLEAGRLEESGKRYERQVSEIDSGGFQSSRDYSQNWQSFVSAEMAKNPGLRDSGYTTWMRDVDLDGGRTHGPQRDARDVLEDRFQRSYVEDMQRDLGPVGPLGAGSIANPSSVSAAGVQGWGRSQIGEINAAGPQVNIAADSRDAALSGLAGDRIAAANERMDYHQRDTNFSNGDIHRRGEALSGDVGNAQHQTLGSTLPVIGQIFSPGSTVDATNYVRSQGVSVDHGSRITSLDRLMLPAISSVAAGSRDLGLPAPVITSAQDGVHTAPNTLHPDGKALDFRGRNISVPQGQQLEVRVQRALGPDYDVDFETFRNNPANNHLHVEYDPKPKRSK